MVYLTFLLTISTLAATSLTGSSGSTSGAAVVDDLISARCQAKCLVDFEVSTLQEKRASRRQLKHSIIQLCKSDSNCSSCARPCRDAFESIRACYANICKDATGHTKDHCFRSCRFIKDVTEFKPGKCPNDIFDASSSVYASECASSCYQDNDCVEEQKCCLSGCSKFCMLPKLDTNGLLPIPSEVMAIERKRGRSAIVRWVMSQLKPEHEATFSNLYVVQWKWGIRSEDLHMTKWQTISIRTKPYAILKHVLSPGRFYRFRVAAVNVNGSQGFSKESDLFRLSKSPKAPGKPPVIEKGDASFDGQILTQEIHWTAPRSDLPIYQYQVTWYKSPGLENSKDQLISDEPVALRLQDTVMNRDPGSSDYDKVDESFLPSNSKLIPGSEFSAVIDGLEPNREYFVEVHAIVESENEQLHGEKAALVLKTSIPASAASIVEGKQWLPATPASPQLRLPGFSSDSISNSGSALSAFKYAINYESRFDVVPPVVVDTVIEKPYFQNGLLKALLSWQTTKEVERVARNGSFLIAWWPQVCLGSSFPEFALTKPLTATTKDLSFELYELQYSCHYIVSLSVVESGGTVFGRATKLSFQTPGCTEVTVKGDIVPVCPTAAPDIPVKPENLHCKILDSFHQKQQHGTSSSPNITAYCSWSQPMAAADRNIIGYRVISGRQKLYDLLSISEEVKHLPSIDRSTAVIKVLKSDTCEIHLHSLVPDADYIIQVQTLSDGGMSPAVHSPFHTPPWPSEDTDTEQESLASTEVSTSVNDVNNSGDDVESLVADPALLESEVVAIELLQQNSGELNSAASSAAYFSSPQNIVCGVIARNVLICLTVIFTDVSILRIL